MCLVYFYLFACVIIYLNWQLLGFACHEQSEIMQHSSLVQLPALYAVWELVPRRVHRIDQ